jgi:hypothetical protein
MAGMSDSILGSEKGGIFGGFDIGAAEVADEEQDETEGEEASEEQ